MSSRPSLLVALLALASCRIEGVTTDAGPTSTSGDLASRCVAGDRAAGEQWIAELRQARRTQSQASQRASLSETCEAGCGGACLELARGSLAADEHGRFAREACDRGEPRACELIAAATDIAAAGELCDAGEVLGCASLWRLGAGELEALALARRIADGAARGCSDQDGRACSLQAWTRCAGLGECDGAAMDSARRAAALLPEPELHETLALVQCHAGELEQADQTLAAACSAGVQDSCGRRCETLLDATMLVRDSRRADYQRAALLMLLQNDAQPTWYVALSAMDEAELDGFVAMLEAFTPPISDPAKKVAVPAGLREQFPALVESILRSPQLDQKQIRYWFGRLPQMTREQRDNLLDSLRKQWWVVPGDKTRTPQAYVDEVRGHNGGFGR